MTDSIKSEFIKAFQEKFGFGVLTASANDDAAAMLGAAAWAWQASRAAIEVELPFPRSIFTKSEDWDAAEIYEYHVRESIYRQGLRVKP